MCKRKINWHYRYDPRGKAIVSASGQKSRAKTKFYYRRDRFCSLQRVITSRYSKFCDPSRVASFNSPPHGSHLLSGITKRRNWNPLDDWQLPYKRGPRQQNNGAGSTTSSLKQWAPGYCFIAHQRSLGKRLFVEQDGSQLFQSFPSTKSLLARFQDCVQSSARAKNKCKTGADSGMRENASPKSCAVLKWKLNQTNMEAGIVRRERHTLPYKETEGLQTVVREWAWGFNATYNATYLGLLRVPKSAHAHAAKRL